MSYYGGGYTSYSSYASYGASTSYNYNSGYDASSCYATGSYLNNLNNYLHEVRYGSYANQCVNWQNTATTVVLWHLLFPMENDNTWETANNRAVDVTMQIDDAEESLDCFTEGVLAFLEQIGGKISNDTQEIHITLPDNIKTANVHFYHGMLAFLIEIYGIIEVAEKVTIHSPHNEPKDAYKQFHESYDLLTTVNQQKIAIIKAAVSQTNELHDVNERIILENQEHGKKYAITSALFGIVTGLLTAFMATRGDYVWVTAGITVLVICAIIFIVGLTHMKNTHQLQNRTLNSLADMSSVIDQLDALE